MCFQLVDNQVLSTQGQPDVFNLHRLTVVPRLVRWISGTAVPSISFLYADSVYSRKHFPGPVRPARPILCRADACDIGATTSESIPTLEQGPSTISSSDWAERRH